MRTIAHALVTLLLVLPACGEQDDATGARDAAPPPVDNDGDGFSLRDGDCDDNAPDIHPTAPEVCDGRDNNCNGQTDESFDLDDDNVSVCQGDCADNDSTIRPGAPEMIDGKDNDCDGIIDNHTDAFDDDGDGYSEDQGDCDDDNASVGPGALEIQLNEDGNPQGIDDDCDAEIDEPLAACPPVEPGVCDARSFAGAVELCERVASARFESPTSPRARAVVASYGNAYLPTAGDSMIALSSGVAADKDDVGYTAPQPGTDLGNSHAHPAPGPAQGCSPDADPLEVYDYAELTLELLVPTNVQSFSFDFNFLSSEYPEWVCSQYNDRFLALLDSNQFQGNVSFDAQGNPVSVNIGFFTVCEPGSGSTGCTGTDGLEGTGYEGSVGGGTGWLTTTAPVTPGEKITLRFVVFDEGDHILDSAVLIDNFRWNAEHIEGPITVP